MPALAVAATATTTLRIGTFVLASTVRPARLAAWDAHCLSTLSDGRFELGIGTGRPDIIAEAEQLLDAPVTTAAQRLTRVEATIDALRKMDGDQRTPVMIAASGPRARALAATKADIAVLTGGPLVSHARMAEMVKELHNAAGDRADDIELAATIFVVGDEVPPGVQHFLGTDAATLYRSNTMTILPGNTQQIIDELRRRRGSLGISYIIVNATHTDIMAPVVEHLAGR
jgi:alkanesulfonate monooxygenase SsuD/methylene tetrahydromethanopterin reductase-like flavin-dependent oxidoreductase (luciferase family)